MMAVYYVLSRIIQILQFLNSNFTKFHTDRDQFGVLAAEPETAGYQLSTYFPVCKILSDRNQVFRRENFRLPELAGKF